MVVFSSAISFGFGKALELLTDDEILRASKVSTESNASAVGRNWKLSQQRIKRRSFTIIADWNLSGNLRRAIALHHHEHAHQMYGCAAAGTDSVHQKVSGLRASDRDVR